MVRANISYRTQFHCIELLLWNSIQLANEYCADHLRRKTVYTNVTHPGIVTSYLEIRYSAIQFNPISDTITIEEQRDRSYLKCSIDNLLFSIYSLLLTRSVIVSTTHSRIILITFRLSIDRGGCSLQKINPSPRISIKMLW